MSEKEQALPPEVFEAVVSALAKALVADYRARWSLESTPKANTSVAGPSAASPWLTVREAANRARCSVKILYRAVGAGHLRAVRIGARRNMRFREEWVDDWLQLSLTPGTP